MQDYKGIKRKLNEEYKRRVKLLDQEQKDRHELLKQEFNEERKLLDQEYKEKLKLLDEEGKRRPIPGPRRTKTRVINVRIADDLVTKLDDLVQEASQSVPPISVGYARLSTNSRSVFGEGDNDAPFHDELDSFSYTRSDLIRGLVIMAIEERAWIKARAGWRIMHSLDEFRDQDFATYYEVIDETYDTKEAAEQKLSELIFSEDGITRRFCRENFAICAINEEEQMIGNPDTFRFGPEIERMREFLFPSLERSDDYPTSKRNFRGGESGFLQPTC